MNVLVVVSPAGRGLTTTSLGGWWGGGWLVVESTFMDFCSACFVRSMGVGLILGFCRTGELVASGGGKGFGMCV